MKEGRRERREREGEKVLKRRRKTKINYPKFWKVRKQYSETF